MSDSPTIEELRESRDFLFNIINAIHNPIFLKDSEHRMVLVNDAFCEFYGRKRDDIIGKTERVFAPKESVDIFWQKDDEVIRSGNPQHYEIPVRNIAGSLRTLLVRKSRYVDKNGQQYVLGVTQDVTEIKAAKNAEIRTEEINRLNNIMIGREERMVGLKKEIEALKKKITDAGLPVDN